MTYSMPDQRSTTDQLEDVAAWAADEGLTEIVAWIQAPPTPKPPLPSKDDYRQALKWATEQRMYDAADWMKYRYTGRYA